MKFPYQLFDPTLLYGCYFFFRFLESLHQKNIPKRADIFKNAVLSMKSWELTFEKDEIGALMRV